jgi:hypothetical protein
MLHKFSVTLLHCNENFCMIHQAVGRPARNPDGKEQPVSESDRQMLETQAEYLRSELAVMPRHQWNAIKVSDREAELIRIEAKLAREALQHSGFMTRRQELAAKFYDMARHGGGR